MLSLTPPLPGWPSGSRKLEPVAAALMTMLWTQHFGSSSTVIEPSTVGLSYAYSRTTDSTNAV